ncbi:hypothetical protein PR048_006967 [Dryococelus australis]|uniref:Uncharacterized protein n=1 Tax=Dryococelus australis TaxID=614101 RepID=A0ABQ9ICG0_9NEOP|nr:hypothetical protein PR048_006967 [Dryococelus australis]
MDQRRNSRSGYTGYPRENPAASPGTNPTCVNPGDTRPGIEPESPRVGVVGVSVGQASFWKTPSWCAAVAQWLARPPRRSGFIPGSSHVGIVLDNAACRRVFSGCSRFPRPCLPAPLHPRVSFSCNVLGMTGTYGSQLESPSLGECCLVLGSLPARRRDGNTARLARRSDEAARRACYCRPYRSLTLDAQLHGPLKMGLTRLRPLHTSSWSIIPLCLGFFCEHRPQFESKRSAVAEPHCALDRATYLPRLKRAAVAERIACSPPPLSRQGEPGSISGRVTPGFSHLGTVADDAVGARGYSNLTRLVMAGVLAAVRAERESDVVFTPREYPPTHTPANVSHPHQSLGIVSASSSPACSLGRGLLLEAVWTPSLPSTKTNPTPNAGLFTNQEYSPPPSPRLCFYVARRGPRE